MSGRVHSGWGRRLVLIVVGALLAAGMQPPGVAAAGDPAPGPIVLTGTARVGSALRIANPDPDATYQWYRSGHPIPKFRVRSRPRTEHRRSRPRRT